MVKRTIGPIFFVLILVAAFFAFHHRSQKTDLKPIYILSYSSFNSLLGPGKKLKKLFEKSCSCKLHIINGGEAGLLIQKMQYLDQVDAVVGLDQFTLDRARDKYKWQPLNLQKSQFIDELRDQIEGNFVPFDWSPLTIIYKKSSFKSDVSAIKSLSGWIRLGVKKQLSLQDPRTSTPGMHFLWWLYSQDPTLAIVKKLKPLMHSVSPSWDTSYGLFQRGQVKLTFSYLTSLLYHWLETKDYDYTAYVGESGHPYQIEYAGVPMICTQCELAKKFVKFLLQPEVQRLLMTKNYMLPTVDLKPSPAILQKLPKLKLLSKQSFKQFKDNYDSTLEKWEAVVFN